MATRKLPWTLFCKVQRTDDGEEWLTADASLNVCMGDDAGPRDIGVYQLVEVQRVERQHIIQSTVPIKRRRARTS